MSISEDKRLVAAAVITLAGIAIVAACSSDATDATPSRTVVPAGDASTNSSSGSTTNDSGVGGTDEDAAVDPSCESDAGCFICDAGRSIDILNECTDDQCQPFDNVARLPLYVPGQPLPALPSH